jgi:hypothetical protein
MKTAMNKNFIILCISFILIIAGCRDEITNTENTNPSADSLLFSKDSIYSGPLLGTSDANFRILDTNITRIKVSYSLETDDVTDTATTSTFSIITDSSFTIQKFGSENNGDFNYTCNIKLKNLGYADAIFRVDRYVNSNFYIVMRNIKLYKTN